MSLFTRFTPREIRDVAVASLPARRELQLQLAVVAARDNLHETIWRMEDAGVHHDETAPLYRLANEILDWEMGATDSLPAGWDRWLMGSRPDGVAPIGATIGIAELPYSWGRSRRAMVAATKATRRRFDGARYHANPYFDPWAFAGVRRDGTRQRWTGHHAADCPCRACTRAYGHPVDRW
jgi:hypothetical protein